MKTKLTIVGTMLLAAVAQATVYDSGTINVNTAIPDNNPSGYASGYTFATGDANTINGVSVTLNISGGYNGDLYGYLVNPNGNMAVLLDRVGQTGGNYGYSDAGMNVVLTDGAANGSIHDYQNVSGYASLISSGGAFTPDNGTGSFTALNSGSANGQWTLFLADMSAGSQSQLVSWDLNVSVVPEPVTYALGIFGGALALLVLGCRIARQN